MVGTLSLMVLIYHTRSATLPFARGLQQQVRDFSDRPLPPGLLVIMMEYFSHHRRRRQRQSASQPSSKELYRRHHRDICRLDIRQVIFNKQLFVRLLSLT